MTPRFEHQNRTLTVENGAMKPGARPILTRRMPHSAILRIAGRRRNTWTRALDGLLALFGDRVLPFDTDAARHYAALAVAARNAGRGFPTLGGCIAAIAASRGFIVASRGTSRFEAGGIQVANPRQT